MGDDLLSAERRAAHLLKVVSSLEDIVQDHAGTDMAVRLVMGEQVGPISVIIAKAALQEASVVGGGG